jgi:hypothetical protein
MSRAEGCADCGSVIFTDTKMGKLTGGKVGFSPFGNGTISYGISPPSPCALFKSWSHLSESECLMY